MISLSNTKKNGEIELKESNSELHLVRHITLDFYDCDDKILRNSKLLESILNSSAKTIGATIVSSNFNEFEPQGVTGIVVLNESHFKIHTCPEFRFAAIDMFAHSDIKFEKGIQLLTNALKSKNVKLITDLKRGSITQFNNINLNNEIELVEKNNNWEESFNNSNAWGIASGVDVFGCDPDLIRSESAIKKYVKDLCDLIQMKRYGNTNVVHFGEDEKVAGYSMTQLIETSLVSGHFANKTNVAYIDIFSCKYYHPFDVANFTIRYFKGKYYKINVNIRDKK